MNISKELLSEVSGHKVTEIYGIVGNEVRYETSDFEIHMKFSPFKCSINIYELAHKCKEWAIKQNLVLSSWMATKNDARCEIGNYETYFIAQTESEAIFNACQWILENKDK
jgi:hypothetical protein